MSNETSETSAAGAADVDSAIDFLCKEFNHGYYYKPVSERAKAYFARAGFVSVKFPGWPGFHNAPAVFACRANLPNLKIKMCETTESDPDGPPVGLPIRTPHRYTLLGFTPHKFGEHTGG